MSIQPARATTWRSSLALRFLVVVPLALSLGGCSGTGQIVPPGAFTHVDQARQELDLDAAGEVQLEDKYGGGLWFGGEPTFVAIVSGSGAASSINAQLADLGYTEESSEISATYWERGSDRTRLNVTVHIVEPGDKVLVSNEELVSVKTDGATIEMRGSR